MKVAMHISAILALALLSPLSAVADSGVFFGAKAGLSVVDEDHDDILELDDDINLEAYGGVMFNEWIGIEVAAFSLGSFEVNKVSGIPINGADPIDYIGARVALALEGEFYKGTNVFFRMGPYYIETDSGSRDEADTGLYYEAGLAIPIMKAVDLTLSWQNYRDIEVLKSGLETGVDTYNIGARVRF